MSYRPSSTLDIWLKAQEALLTAKRGVPAMICEIGSPDKAQWLVNELYRRRSKVRKLSMRGTEPGDPKYNTSPWDNFTLRIRDGDIEFWHDDHDLGTVVVNIPNEVRTIARKRFSHTKPRTKKPKTTEPEA